MVETRQVQTVGRRKTSVARVLVRPGAGVWSVNGRPLEEYFPRVAHRIRAEEAVKVAGLDGQVDIRVRVTGGGLTGQADAIRMGLARAMADGDVQLDPGVDRDEARRALAALPGIGPWTVETIAIM